MCSGPDTTADRLYFRNLLFRYSLLAVVMAHCALAVLKRDTQRLWAYGQLPLWVRGYLHDGYYLGSVVLFLVVSCGVLSGAMIGNHMAPQKGNRMKIEVVAYFVFILLIYMSTAVYLFMRI